MTEVIITAIIAPLLLLIAGFVLEIAKARKTPSQTPDASAPVVGDSVDIGYFAQEAIQNAKELLADEREDHKETILRHEAELKQHRICDQLIIELGREPPHP